MKKLLLVLFAILLLAIAGCGSNPNSEAEKFNGTQAVTYKETSQKKANHCYSVVAVVESKVSKEDMDNLAKKIVAGYYKTDPDLYGVLINITDADVAGIPYTLSQYEYGPGGSFAYDEVKKDEPRTLKLVNDRSKKDWSKRPSQDDYKIFILYTKYLTKTPGSNEQQFIDQFSGKKPTAEQVRKSVDKVEAWIMQ